MEWWPSEEALHHLVARVITGYADLDFVFLSVFSTDSTRMDMFGVVICALEFDAAEGALGFCL